MIKENVKRLLSELPKGVALLAAAKERNADEISEAIRAGVTIIGENYLQDAQKVLGEVKEKAEWHFIGHLQTKKAKKIVDVFDMIESVDSLRLAQEIERCCARRNKVMPVLIEVNSGEEEQKYGVLPKDLIGLIKEISPLKHIKIMGLMTMGPRFGNPEESRPYFVRTRNLFDQTKDLHLPNVEMKHLSMGMTNSYQIAIEEGANLVRIGTKIFGVRRES
ncbi:MAG: YggS family pyridoxal phosphate-dependent enzyme [Deltaproteobacteria bacterium]|nr:YggS family pyridoxal phosphate-dependent enzyme [Deltaproteobacteria bacterium]MBW2338956.1 YggS family pyridoxal phosphate-dependent enzyme [Deltaproteobacteria bacterium]